MQAYRQQYGPEEVKSMKQMRVNTLSAVAGMQDPYLLEYIPLSFILLTMVVIIWTFDPLKYVCFSSHYHYLCHVFES